MSFKLFLAFLLVLVGLHPARADMGALTASMKGEDAGSGAMGAIVAETLADLLTQNLQQRSAEIFVEEAQKGPVNPVVYRARCEKEITSLCTTARLGTAAIALGTGMNVVAAHGSAQTALEHNTVQVATMAVEGLASLGAVTSLILGYQLIQLYQEQGLLPALRHAQAEGHLTVEDTATGPSYKVGDQLCATPWQAWQALMEGIPLLKVLGKAMGFDPAPTTMPWQDQGFQTAPSVPQMNSTPLPDPQAPMPGFVPETPSAVQEGFEAETEHDASILEDKIHILYEKRHPSQPGYVGRTSGEGNINKEDDIRNIVRSRDRNHHKNAEGFIPAEPLYASENPDVIRGMEQTEIEKRGGAQKQGGTSSNVINSISNHNPNRQRYMDAARQAGEESQ